MASRERTGEYIQCSVVGESYKAYLPDPLPPNPPIQVEDLYHLLDRANAAIGGLDVLSLTLPDPSLFLDMYVRKEAVFSSQIEGTQSSLSDLLMFENTKVVAHDLNDAIDVSNYVMAMEHGLQRIQGGFPLSLRLIREMHEILLSKGRGSTKEPGEFRRSQNWIGGTRPGNAKFVPPPPEKVMDLLGDLEKFLHDETVKMPTLIKAALAHVQFETIHPFLDGNGRLGRLLITFILCVDGVMKQPMLYLSLYFKKNRQLYYEHLQLVRGTGDWEEWLRFFLKGVIETAEQAVDTIQAILKLFHADTETIKAGGQAASSALIVHQHLKRHPITDAKKITENCNMTMPTANKSLNKLQDLGLVVEITGRARNKIYAYQNYLNILNQEGR